MIASPDARSGTIQAPMVSDPERPSPMQPGLWLQNAGMKRSTMARRFAHSSAAGRFHVLTSCLPQITSFRSDTNSHFWARLYHVLRSTSPHWG